MTDVLSDAQGLLEDLKRASSRDETVTSDRVEEWARTIKSLMDEVERLRKWTTPVPASYGDISDLPLDLLDELSAAKTDERERQLHTIIRAADGEIDLDLILIELYRRFGVKETRKHTLNKLYRMSQRGVIASVPGKKGVYCHPNKQGNEPKEAHQTSDTDDLIG